MIQIKENLVHFNNIMNNERLSIELCSIHGVWLEETSTVRLKKEPSSPSKRGVKERYRVLKRDGNVQKEERKE